MSETTPTTLPHSHAQRWLLAYDIKSPKRLQKVWRYLRKEGQRLQYSVYILAGHRQQIQTIMDALSDIIEPREDDVRIYPLGENTRIWGLGTQFDDGGNTLSDAIIDRLVVKSTPDGQAGDTMPAPLSSPTP